MYVVLIIYQLTLVNVYYNMIYNTICNMIGIRIHNKYPDDNFSCVHVVFYPCPCPYRIAYSNREWAKTH